MKRKLFVTLLILALLTGLLALPAGAAPVLESGECGANGNDVIWTLDRDGLLTVSGAGAMYDYDRADDVPWHAYVGQITSVTIEPGVTNVGSNAFHSCAQLATVTLPETGLRSINVMAFYQCASLASVTIPASVTKIGDNAFGFCALTSLDIPAGVTDIGGSAFYRCADLTAINVDEANTTYSSGDGILFNHDKTELICFPAKKDVTEYTAPASVTTVGSYAFHSNPTLEKVTFPTVKDDDGRPKAADEAGKLETISAYAFAYSAKLKEITFPSTLSEVGDYAFFECTSLSDDDGKATGKVYYEGSRQEWTALSIGNLGNSRLTNSEVVFTDMVQDNIAASGECGSQGNNASWALTKDGELRISGSGAMQDYRNAASVPWAEYKADNASPQIQKVTVLDGITNVGDYAFFECHRLTEVNLAGSVTRIGSPDSLYSRAFADCSALTTINLSETAAEFIGNYAFNGCSALTSVTFPETLLTIGGRAFLNCTGLTRLTLPASVTDVGDWAFRGCTSLTALTMEPVPGGEQAHYMAFGSYALADCAALTSVSFSENLTVLGDYAMTRCNGLQRVTLPSGVSGVGNCAFLSCPSLTAVEVSDDNQTYCSKNSMLMNKDQTYIVYCPPAGRTACTIPYGITGVAAYAFQDATGLQKVFYDGSPNQWEAEVLPNIALPNDPLFTLTADVEDTEHFECTGTDPVQTTPTSINLFAAETTEEGQRVVAQIHCGDDALGARVLCAMYREGRFLGIASGSILDEEENPVQTGQMLELSRPGEDYSLSFTPSGEADMLYLFVMDGENHPQCPRDVCEVVPTEEPEPETKPETEPEPETNPEPETPTE